MLILSAESFMGSEINPQINVPTLLLKMIIDTLKDCTVREPYIFKMI